MKSLNDANVDYVIIGGMAMPYHGYARLTVDIDLFIRATSKNAQACLKALKAFGYDTEDLTVDDLLNNKILIRQYIVETDLHPFVAGVTFDEVWQTKVTGEFEGVQVYFASLDALISMKKAAGRPKDLEDLRALEIIRRRQ